MYSRDDVYRCAAKDNLKWLVAMGDSQEREFIAMMKMINGTVEAATKFESVRRARAECCVFAVAVTLVVGSAAGGFHHEWVVKRPPNDVAVL